MPSITSLSDALTTLQTYLQGKFDSSEDFGTMEDEETPLVDVIKVQAEQSAPEQVGKPHVVLSGTDEPAPDWGWYARKATVRATCKASEYAGAIEGTANPEAAQEKMARIMAEWFDDDYAVIRDLGLMAPEIRKGESGEYAETADTSAMAFVDTTITFYFLTR